MNKTIHESILDQVESGNRWFINPFVRAAARWALCEIMDLRFKVAKGNRMMEHQKEHASVLQAALTAKDEEIASLIKSNSSLREQVEQSDSHVVSLVTQLRKAQRGFESFKTGYEAVAKKLNAVHEAITNDT